MNSQLGMRSKEEEYSDKTSGEEECDQGNSLLVLPSSKMLVIKEREKK